MKLEFGDVEWGARMFADKVIKEAVQEEIIKLAQVVLGNKTLKISYSEDGFDQYPYCKHWEKKYCPVGGKKKHYMGKWDEWVVFGHTRLDVYLGVLRLLANDSSVYTPIVAPRKDDKWVERDKVAVFKDE